MARKIRTLRHWKQRFNPNAAFVFRKTTRWDGRTTFQAGDPVPEGLLPPHRLRRYWEAGRIELAEFDEPLNVATGFDHVDDDPERAAVLREVSVEPLGGNWYLVRYGQDQYKERGRKALSDRLDALRDQVLEEQAGEDGARDDDSGGEPLVSAVTARQLRIDQLRALAEPAGIRGRSKAELIEALQTADLVGPDYDPDADPKGPDQNGAGADGGQARGTGEQTT